MQFLIDKAKTTAVIIIALLMASVALMAMPVQAQETSRYLPAGAIPTNVRDTGSLTSIPSGVTPDKTYDTKAFLSITPNPVGRGQQILVNMWLGPALMYQYFSDYKVTITKPDGTTHIETLDSYPADCTGWFNYIVDQVGTYKIKFDFPGGFFYAGNYSIPAGAWVGSNWLSLPQSRWYKPSSDGPYDLVVQSEMVVSWPASPLPTDYWTRPISPENREWWPIAGYYPATGVVGWAGDPNWPAGTNTYMSNYLYTPYVQAPNTAHIVWRRKGNLGGLMGGYIGYLSYSAGGGGPTIVYQGRCYQTFTRVVDGTSRIIWQCYDLRTGQVYWEQKVEATLMEVFPGFFMSSAATPSFIIYEPGYPEVTGGEASFGKNVYLGGIAGGRLIKWNPYNGAVVQNISLAPLTSGTYYANLDSAYFLTVQNLGGGKYRLINFTAHGDPGPSASLINLTMRVMNNITWPFSSLGFVDYEAGIAATTMGVTSPATGINEEIYVMAASITTGQLLWNHTAGFYGYSTYSQSIADHGKFAIHMTDGRIHCYDLASGKHLWDNDISTQNVWSAWFSYGIQGYGGNIISNQYNGIAAYDWDTGKLSWLYQAPTPYQFETPYEGYYSFFTTPDVIADGKIYAYTGEHTSTQPITRGWAIHCINATNGAKIWSVTGSMTPGAVADGYLTASNSYDGYMYVFGKGKSATTVTAPDTAVPKGTTVLIKGTVMDMSPGDQGTFDNPTAWLDSSTAPGTVPCVSKESMATQMEYLYMQRPIDGIFHNATITGVPVILTAIGSDGTVIDIGTTTTNGYGGTFGMAWTPPKEDTYTIMASFNGDDSYGSSMATTAVTVGPAPATPSPTPTAQPQVAPDNTGLIYATLAAVIVAIIIGIVAILVGLRKRQ